MTSKVTPGWCSVEFSRMHHIGVMLQPGADCSQYRLFFPFCSYWMLLSLGSSGGTQKSLFFPSPRRHHVHATILNIQITRLEARRSAPPRCVRGQEHSSIVPHLNLPRRNCLPDLLSFDLGYGCHCTVSGHNTYRILLSLNNSCPYQKPEKPKQCVLPHPELPQRLGSQTSLFPVKANV